MQNEIVKKLNGHLNAGIAREADVVYTLAEIRKLFEHTRAMKKYPVLAFYTNWALHTKIDREPWAKAGLKILEDTVCRYQAGSGQPEEVLREVTDLFSFQKLHRELLDFGAEYGIRFQQLSNPQWRRFSELLIDVLVDCPLHAEVATGKVKSLALTRDFALSHAGGQTLAFWKIDLGNGRVMTGSIF
jgi:hypothetical protein